MKLSVSLPDEDVEALDRYATEHATSRSGALQRAVSLLRQRELGEQYRAAWSTSGPTDIRGTGDGVWDTALADGLADETW